MLHLIYQEALNPAILQRIASNDNIIFLESSVFQLNKNAKVSVNVQNLLTNNVKLHVLAVDLETRGISAGELLVGIEVIDYSSFVELTVKNKVVKTWS